MAESFKTYLIGKGRSSATVESIEKGFYLFLQWTEDEQIEAEYATYAEVISYIKHLQNRGVQQKTVYSHINELRNYFDWIIKRKIRTDNPAKRIEVKGIKRRTLHEIVPRNELETLYSGFEVNEEIPSTMRNKCMLGLMIWQGLGTHELQALNLHDLKLREGKVFIAGSRKSAERELKLESAQMLDLMEYIMKIRPQLLGDKQTDQFFISGRGSTELQGVIAELMKKIRKLNTSIKSMKQVRASVIVHWLKNYNLRQAQYMAGHKYISSTEAYLVNDLDDLQKDIEQFHPIV